MRTIKSTGLVHDEDITKWPDGQIQNEDETKLGTPVVREIYGDVLTNIYAIMRDAGVIPNETEDNSLGSYQLLEAFKKFSNELNDLQHVVTLNASVASVNFNIDSLPDNYVFVGKASENYNSALTYSFNGTGANSYDMSSDNGFNALDTVIVVINQTEVKITSLSSFSNDIDLNTSLGAPLGFNSSNKVSYLLNGKLVTNTPSSDDIQQVIKTDNSNSNLNIVDAIIHKESVLCLVLDVATTTYELHSFSINDLTASSSVTVSGFSFPIGVDNQPYMYCDGTNVYLTNASGNSFGDYIFNKMLYNQITNTFSFVGSFSIDATFQKTTNAFITGDFLFTFVSGNLEKFNLNTGVKTYVDFYDIVNGVVFKHNSKTYFTNADTAVKWNI